PYGFASPAFAGFAFFHNDPHRTGVPERDVYDLLCLKHSPAPRARPIDWCQPLLLAPLSDAKGTGIGHRRSTPQALESPVAISYARAPIVGSASLRRKGSDVHGERYLEGMEALIAAFRRNGMEAVRRAA